MTENCFYFLRAWIVFCAFYIFIVLIIQFSSLSNTSYQEIEAALEVTLFPDLLKQIFPQTLKPPKLKHLC